MILNKFHLFLIFLMFSFLLSKSQSADIRKAEKYLMQTMSYIEEENFEKAKYTFRKIENLNVEPPNIFYYYMGFILYETTDYNISEEYLKKYIKIDGKNGLHYSEAKKYLKQIKIRKKEMNRKVKPEMVFVKGGSFYMGSNSGRENEKPVHKVKIESFYIDKYELTVGEYKKFCKETSRSLPTEPRYGWKDNYPIVNVSWNDAKAYAEWIGKRLPTEAEWEYAARGGPKSESFDFSGSSNIYDVAWYNENSNNKMSRIGKKLPNEIGICDMSGNVWEWCEDFISNDYYQESPKSNPKGPESGVKKILRGGSWFFYQTFSRVSYRYSENPEVKNYDIGFRMVKDVKAKIKYKK